MGRLEKILDAHIHLDQYEDAEIAAMSNVKQIEGVISVSMDLPSCKRNLKLSQLYHFVKPAFGFHPEQPLPTDHALSELLFWMEVNKDKMVAIGEVGLPFFMRAENKISPKEYERYIELLEMFVKQAKILDKPLALHAVYSDAPIVCDILEKYSVTKAHFHWFKGDKRTIDRMIENGYFVSITPELVMNEEESVKLLDAFPLNQIMLETDGPWPFEGPYSRRRTHPIMIIDGLKKVSERKKISLKEATKQIYDNTHKFYGI
ncbi:TatD family hydrolase [Bacillus sp. T3]|uniref:TatD family hydrolase n=1 Tax=Bacillus sp. T3 TaxID=467262 RepID=UPI0029812333|nr:TatD family hydrolase [Bacillus sp. T3]